MTFGVISKGTKKLIVLLALIVFGILLPVRMAFADDATVLHKGAFTFYVDGLISFPITERFKEGGGTEPLAVDFNLNLNSDVFSPLSLVEAGFGLPAGSATFGESVVDFERHIQIYNFRLGYGVTDRLSVGVQAPYWVQSIDVNAQLDNSTATVGFNPAVPGGVAPIGFAGTPPPTAEDIQSLLESQGFRRVEDWSDEAFGDVLVGARYQYYQSENWRLAATGAVQFPTGKWDDPNNLVDNNTGWDAWGLLIQLHQDYLSQEPGIEKRLGYPSPGSFFINTTFRYQAIFPDEKPFRVCDIHTPLCPNFDPNVERDVGDIVEAEISGTVGLLVKGLTVTPIFTYSHKFEDDFSGDLGFDYGLLAIESDYDSLVFQARISFSTVPLFIEEKFPFPIDASVQYWDRIAGNNNQFNSRYIGFILQAYF